MLVETIPVEQLVDKLRNNSRRTAQEIRQKSECDHSSLSLMLEADESSVIESANDDDDIQSGPQKMSLKCPVS